MQWLFVDDSSQERTVLAGDLTSGDLEVVPISGKDARARLADRTLAPAGILMDIELGNETGFLEDGLSLTAAIRADQNREVIGSFPVVRFSRRTKVAEYVGSDSSSDASFDWAVEKEVISSPEKRRQVQRNLIAFAQVYETVTGTVSLPEAMGLDSDQWALFGHSSLTERFRTLDRDHLKAGLVVQAIVTPGVLIDLDLLTIRLGIRAEASEGWEKLQRELEAYSYRGAGSATLQRWWARGVEFWWEDRFGSDDPLSGLEVEERCSRLSTAFGAFKAIDPVAVSPGKRFWRFCSITKQEYGEILPVDPEFGVPMTPRTPPLGWEDPLYAALGPAGQRREDPRLDAEAIERIQRRCKDT